MTRVSPATSLALHLTSLPTEARSTKPSNENLKPSSSFSSCLLLPINLFYSDTNSSPTKLLFPAPHFIVRSSSSLGPTKCLALDLVQGVTDAFIIDRQHDQGDPDIQRIVRRSQHRFLQAMAENQITLAQFQAPVGGYGKKVVVGVCDLWSEAEPSQNKKKRARSLIRGWSKIQQIRQ